jgi:hypothetical protein
MSSHFNRVETSETTTFNVTPAPFPIGSFGRQTAFWVAVAIAGVPLAFVIIGLWMVPAGIYFASVTNRARKQSVAEAASRKPTSIIVTKDLLKLADRDFLLAEIKDFLVTHKTSGTQAATVHLVRSRAEAAGVNAALRLNAEQERLSYQVSIRLLSDSRPELLVSGLTKQTANALVDDLAELVVQRRSLA